MLNFVESFLASMSKQEQQDDGQQSEFRSLPHTVPQHQLYRSSNTGLLPQSQSRRNFGDIYQPAIHRAGGPAQIPLQQAMSSAGQSASEKLPIPPLRGGKAEGSKGSKKGRTSHACDACRKAKAGCSGGQPCARCRTTRSTCVYGDGKRDRERKCADSSGITLILS